NMSKSTSYFECLNCSFQTVKWIGCCPECKAWNTFDQISTSKFSTTNKQITPSHVAIHTLDDIKLEEQQRITSTCCEWDRVTGGGIVPGAFMLISGDPGIGKSTLLLQLCTQLPSDKTIFYFS